MSYFKKFLALILAGSLVFALTGCLSSAEEDGGTTPASSEAVSEPSSEPSSEAGSSETNEDDPSAPFDASAFCDDFGRYKDLDAGSYVTLADIDNIEIPYDSYHASDEAVQEQIDQILSSHVEKTQIMEGTVKDGDTVNIDYVGSQDGVEFAGGSTGGNGTEVTIGVTSYIDGFLDQLIGHKPGENFDINVTFPDPYPNNPDLAGKPAVFNITINYIVGEELPVLSDAFVEENYGESMGWKTIDEMKAGIASALEEDLTLNYLSNYVIENSTMSEEPQIAKDYWRAYLEWYIKYICAQYGITLDEYFANQGVTDFDGIMEKQADTLHTQITYDVVMQAIGEKIGYEPSEEEIAAYMDDYYGSGYYDYYKETVPRSTLLKPVINELTLKKLAENARLLPMEEENPSAAD